MDYFLQLLYSGSLFSSFSLKKIISYFTVSHCSKQVYSGRVKRSILSSRKYFQSVRKKKKVQALTLYTCFNLALRKCGTTDVIRFNHCSVAVKQRSLVCSKAKLPPQKREKRKKERKREKKGFEQHFGLTFLELYLHSSSLLAIMNYVHRTKQMWPWGLQIVSL